MEFNKDTQAHQEEVKRQIGQMFGVQVIEGEQNIEFSMGEIKKNIHLVCLFTKDQQEQLFELFHMINGSNSSISCHMVLEMKGAIQ